MGPEMRTIFLGCGVVSGGDEQFADKRLRTNAATATLLTSRIMAYCSWKGWIIPPDCGPDKGWDAVLVTPGGMKAVGGPSLVPNRVRGTEAPPTLEFRISWNLGTLDRWNVGTWNPGTLELGGRGPETLPTPTGSTSLQNSATSNSTRPLAGICRFLVLVDLEVTRLRLTEAGASSFGFTRKAVVEKTFIHAHVLENQIRSHRRQIGSV